MSESWTDKAACRTAPPEAFYPVHGAPPRAATEVIATWCLGCPVRQDCLADVEGRPRSERWGINGGVVWRGTKQPIDPFRLLARVGAGVAS